MKRSLTLLSTLVACLPLALGCEQPAAPAAAGGNSEAAAKSAASGEEAPAAKAAPAESKVKIQYLGYDGIQELIKSHKGKVVVVDCWSTWCEPCKKEFPGLVALHEKYGADKIACVSFCLDFEGLKKETPEEHEPEVRKFLEAQKAAFDNVISNEPSEELYEKLSVSTVPVVFVYDQQGELAQTFKSGGAKDKPFTYKDIGETVAKLLKDEG